MLSYFSKAVVLSVLCYLLLISCDTSKVFVRKIVDARATTYPAVSDYYSAFLTLNPEKTKEFADRELTLYDKNAYHYGAIGIEHILKNRYDDAAYSFMKAVEIGDSIDYVWCEFLNKYYSQLNYFWYQLRTIGHKIPEYDRWLIDFYYDMPAFVLEFVDNIDSVAIPLKLVSGTPVITLSISGKKFDIALSTSTPVTTIGRQLSEALDVDFCAFYDDTHRYPGRCYIPELDFGNIVVYNLPAQCYDTEFVTNPNAATNKFHGVIGWDLLHHFDFTIDYKKSILILRKPYRKDVLNSNLLWYGTPIIRFYDLEGIPFLTQLAVGNDRTIFTDFVLNSVDRDSSEYKTSGVNLRKLDTLSLFSYNSIDNLQFRFRNVLFTSYENSGLTLASPIRLQGIIGNDAFKNKTIRIDMMNGLFFDRKF